MPELLVFTWEAILLYSFGRVGLQFSHTCTDDMIYLQQHHSMNVVCCFAVCSIAVTSLLCKMISLLTAPASIVFWHNGAYCELQVQCRVFHILWRCISKPYHRVISDLWLWPYGGFSWNKVWCFSAVICWPTYDTSMEVHWTVVQWPLSVCWN